MMLLITHRSNSNLVKYIKSGEYEKLDSGYIIGDAFYEISSGFIFKETEESEVVQEVKSQKLVEIQISAQNALKTFQFNSMTFELSGESKANLIAMMPRILSGEFSVFPWDALDFTYGLNDPDVVVLSKDVIFDNEGNPRTSRVEDFAAMFEIKTGQVRSWKETQKHYLSQAATYEEVDAISTNYNG